MSGLGRTDSPAKRDDCAKVRARIIDAVVGSPKSEFDMLALEPYVAAHLANCAGCAEFLADLVSIQRMAERDRTASENDARRRLEVPPSGSFIDTAIDEGLTRKERLPGWKGASLLENVAFLAFAILILSLQFTLFSRLRPEVVLGVEVALNWLAPFAFYAIYRLDSKTARGGEEDLR